MGKRNKLLFYPLSLIFGLITSIRNLLYNKGIIISHQFDIPLICVGNITVGGTGKTPHTEYLVSILRKDYKVAVLSRGYRRRSAGFKIVKPQSTVAEAGDEPLQIARKFQDITVAVDRKRLHGVKMITSLFPETEVIILDDAFQHRKIKPGYSILLTDSGRLFTGDSLLPYGNLRESIRNISRADLIVVTKTPADITETRINQISGEISSLSDLKIFFTGLSYKDPVPLFKNALPVTFSEKKIPGILLVTGIADPSYLIKYIEDKTDELVHLKFPDHHFFSSGDIEEIMKKYEEIKSVQKIILTTEKDAVRLREFANITEPFRSSFHYLPVEVCFMNDRKDEFDKLITEYVGRNKRNM